MITSDTIISVTSDRELHLVAYTGSYFEAAALVRERGGEPFPGIREESGSTQLYCTCPCTGAWAGTMITTREETQAAA